jgi:hypothetical protein
MGTLVVRVLLPVVARSLFLWLVLLRGKGLGRSVLKGPKCEFQWMVWSLVAWADEYL